MAPSDDPDPFDDQILWRCARCGASVWTHESDPPPTCNGTMRVGKQAEVDVHEPSKMTSVPDAEAAHGR